MEERASPSAMMDDDPLPLEGSPERLLAERKLVRKLDTRVLPTIVLIYIMNYIDVRLRFFAIVKRALTTGLYISATPLRLQD